MTARRRAVFLDRDGVLNRKAPEGDYVKNPGELELLPGAGGAVARLRAAGLAVVVVSNQRGVARGLMDARDLAAVTEALVTRLESAGGAPDAFYYCTHDEHEGCPCRKPRPGLLLRAASEQDLELGASWMVGDRETDVLAGRAAGCRTVLVGGNPGRGLALEDSSADVLAADLRDAASRILAEHPSP